MTANTMREAFEDHAYYWARSLTVVDGEYCDDEVNSAWLYFKAGAAWQAAQSVPVEDVVLPIANAYESGIGHCNDSLCNPYKEGSAEAFAYDYGKEFGKSRGIKQSVPVMEEPVALLAEAHFSQLRKGKGAVVKPFNHELIVEDDIALYGRPTTFITAAELEALRKDAERYRWLRAGNIVEEQSIDQSMEQGKQ